MKVNKLKTRFTIGIFNIHKVLTFSLLEKKTTIIIILKIQYIIDWVFIWLKNLTHVFYYALKYTLLRVHTTYD